MAAQKAKKNVLYFHSEQLDLINFPCKKLTAKPSDIFFLKKTALITNTHKVFARKLICLTGVQTGP